MWRQQVVQFSIFAKADVLWSKQVQFYISQINFNMRNALAYCYPVVAHANYEEAMSSAQLAEEIQDALLYGDASRDLRAGLQISPATFELFLRDGCIENGGYWYTMDQCKNTFYNGLVGKGLQSTFKEYVQLVRRLMTKRLIELESGSCESDNLDTGDALTVQQFSEQYLAAGFQQASELRSQESLDYLSQFASLNILVTIMSIISLFLFYFIVYAPMISRLDHEIKMVRMLLLLFPDQVARCTPAIVAASREMLKDTGSVAGSVTGSTLNNLLT
jgi:hypothetical protein